MVSALNPSHLKGHSTEPLIEKTIGAMLREAALRWPVADALVSAEQRVRWTFAELNDRVDAVAAGLLALGLEPGDRVGIWAPNCVEWTLTQFATARAGLIQVNINPSYRLAELEYTLTKVGVKALIAANAFKGSDYLAMIEQLAPEIAGCRPGMLTATRLPRLRMVIKIGGEKRAGWLEFEGIRSVDQAPLRRIQEHLRATDAINIQFTSGTTGLPKGATLSHRNILNNAFFIGQGIGLRAGDRVCIPVPLHHCFGMVAGNLACITHGATMVYPGAGFDALATLECIQSERCTVIYGVPTMFIAQLDHPEFHRFDLRSLRTGIMAGSPCPIEVMRRVVERMHAREMTIAYGMTETSPVSFHTASSDTLERRVSSVGQIHPHVEAKVIDAEGAIVPRGQRGELCVRGYSVMIGYWDDLEKTAEVIDEQGWMHTGDLVTIDAAGYCNVVGRLNDMIIRGGENVYPREIEEFLFKHPGIADVAIVGLPHEKLGEEVCAWIKLREGVTATQEEIRAYCRGQLAHYKVPGQVVFIAEFPLTATGKIQKFVIREQMMTRLGRSEQVTA